MYSSISDSDAHILADAESVKHKVELVLLRVRNQMIFGSFALITTFSLFAELMKLILSGSIEQSNFGEFLPGLMLLVGFVLIQSIRCVMESVSLYGSTMLTRRRVDTSIEKWHSQRSEAKGYE
ncbi:hypothetical protein A1354_11920 [Pseudomonas asplenii]|nr:hypothetical protein [Pseudomonas asplenii]PNG40874.1 hypothetical protein A1354_11920 [Pseudomonas asplenii]